MIILCISIQPFWVGYVVAGFAIVLVLGFYLARPLQTKGIYFKKIPLLST